MGRPRGSGLFRTFARHSAHRLSCLDESPPLTPGLGLADSTAAMTHHRL